MKTKLVKLWATLTAALTFGAVFFLFAYIFVKGASAITWTFLTEAPQGTVLGTEGGILPAILGSLAYTAIAVLFSAILGIGTALYQVFYCKDPRRAGAITLTMQCMSGVPSIVMGLFGYSLLVLNLGWGKCLLAGGVTQGIMILPFVTLRAEKALREVDASLLRASYALGVSRSHTIRRIALPQAAPQLTSGVILGGCYAMGAAAPLIFTGAVILSKIPTDLMKPAMALPYHLYMLLTQGTSPTNAYGTAFVMMVLVLLSNTIAAFLTRRNLT